MNSPSFPLSVIVITRNEERNIVECLKNVSWANDIIIVDSQSTDQTVALAREYARTILVTEWKGYGAAKNLALEKAINSWVLWLDADERVTDGLAAEIRQIISSETGAVQGYEVGRRAFFLGKWIRHCGWYPGYVVRLFTNKNASFSTASVHEHIEIEGLRGRLRHDLLHYTDENIFHYFSKFNRYTSLAAEDLFHGGKISRMYDLSVRPAFMFVKMYIFRLGFLDGMHGFILCLLSSAYVFTKYAKLKERSNSYV